MTPPDLSIRVKRKTLEALESLVNAQAEDEGLWFIDATAPEAYLQRALRELHAVAERVLEK